MSWSYLWPFFEYRNACAGSEMERAAAFRHNKQLAKKELPTYLNRWSAITCLLLAGCVASPAVLAPAVGIAFTIAVCMTVHIAHVYLLFSYH